MKLSNNDVARIFGPRDKTPPELELELAMAGAEFTAASLCKIISAVFFVLDWRQESPPNLHVLSDGKLYVKDVTEPYISSVIIRNIFRMVKFSTVFDNALKEKNGQAVIDRLKKISDRIGDDFKRNYRSNFQSMKWETVCELEDVIKEKQKKLLKSRI